MKTLYFDCAAGASGDMILGALVGAGADPQQLIDQLKLLGFENYQLSFSQVDRCNLSATRATVETSPEHSHRHLADVLKIINDSQLNTSVKDRASHVFSLLAEAESEVHNVPVQQIHFHEVGALDAIIDIVGACIGFELLEIERFVCSPLHVGSGTVEIAQPGLLVGYIDHFAFSPKDEPLGDASLSWLALCREAYRLFNNGLANSPAQQLSPAVERSPIQPEF